MEHNFPRGEKLALEDESKVLDILEKVSKSVVNISTIRLIQNIFYQVFPVKGMGLRHNNRR